MYIVSYDVASKSLALSIIKFNNNWELDLSNLVFSFISDINDKSSIEICEIAISYILKLRTLLDTLIQPILLDVVDLIPNKKIKETDAILRTNRLRGYLTYIDNNYTNKMDNFQVLIEYQMGPNNKSNNVFSQIIYHYSSSDSEFKNSLPNNIIENTSIKNTSIENTSIEKKCAVEIIGPSLKNKINLDKNFPRQYFIEKYSKTYDANKKHSIANLKYWIKTKNAEHMLENIKSKNLDDIADSVTMTLAWIFIKSNLI